MTLEGNLDTAVDDSAETPTRRATYQDVLDAPAHRVAEIVDGTLHLSLLPAPLQALTSGTLQRTLAAPFGRARGRPDASCPREGLVSRAERNRTKGRSKTLPPRPSR